MQAQIWRLPHCPINEDAGNAEHTGRERLEAPYELATPDVKPLGKVTTEGLFCCYQLPLPTYPTNTRTLLLRHLEHMRSSSAAGSSVTAHSFPQRRQRIVTTGRTLRFSKPSHKAKGARSPTTPPLRNNGLI